MFTIEKFKDNLKELEPNVCSYWTYTPNEEQIKNQIKNFGHGLYLIKKWEEKEYWLWFGDDFLIFSRKLSKKQYNIWKRCFKIVNYGK